MVKSELVEALSELHPGMYKTDITMVVDTIFNEMGAALIRGDRIELRGLGAFNVVFRKPISSTNPKTGKPMDVPQRLHVHFKFYDTLKDFINK
ncbi:MAG: HU family DNA-binding protein [Pseudomonadota bacterium]